MPPSQGASWEEWYRWILCELYKKAGGDCKDLNGDDAARASIFVDYIDTKGVPAFATGAEQSEYVALLLKMQTHLALPSNDLPFEIDESLNDTIDKLIDELGE
jgi:hypothetical protein